MCECYFLKETLLQKNLKIHELTNENLLIHQTLENEKLKFQIFSDKKNQNLNLNPNPYKDKDKKIQEILKKAKQDEE